MKEFRYSVGYYFDEYLEDNYCGNIMAWHHCSNTLLKFSHLDFDKYMACPRCGESVLRWQKLGFAKDDEREKSENLYFSTTNLIKVTSDDSKVSVGVFRSEYSICIRNGTDVFTKSDFYECYTINIKTGYSYSYGNTWIEQIFQLNYSKPWSNIKEKN